MRYLFLLFLLLLGCNDSTIQDETVVHTPGYREVVATIEQQPVTGRALEVLSVWNEYRLFKDALQDIDHTPIGIKELYDLSVNLAGNVPEQFQESIYTARIKVLQTRLGIYLSFINQQSRPKPKQEKLFTDVVLAWNELNYHLDYRINSVNAQKQQLLDLLRSERRRDSIRAIARDSMVVDSVER